MRPIRTPDSDVVFTLPGDTTGERDLHAQRVMQYDTDLGETVADARLAHITLWQPTMDEAQRLEAGAVVEVTITGQAYPPISVGVTRAALPERELLPRGDVERAVGHLYGQLKERIIAAGLQLADEIAAGPDLEPCALLSDFGAREALEDRADLIRNGLAHADATALGLPSPAAFADLWADAVKATQEP